jgi:hypothetical protein
MPKNPYRSGVFRTHVEKSKTQQAKPIASRPEPEEIAAVIVNQSRCREFHRYM